MTRRPPETLRAFQVCGINLGNPVDRSGFSADHKVAAAARVTVGIGHPSIRHAEDVPGDHDLGCSLPEVHAGLPLKPVGLVSRRRGGDRTDQSGRLSVHRLVRDLRAAAPPGIRRDVDQFAEQIGVSR